MSVDDELNSLADLNDLRNIQVENFRVKKEIVNKCILKTEELWTEFSKIRIGPNDSRNLLVVDVSANLSKFLNNTNRELLNYKEKLSRLSQAYDAVINRNLEQLKYLTRAERSQKQMKDAAFGLFSTFITQAMNQNK